MEFFIVWKCFGFCIWQYVPWIFEYCQYFLGLTSLNLSYICLVISKFHFPSSYLTFFCNSFVLTLQPLMHPCCQRRADLSLNYISKGLWCADALWSFSSVLQESLHFWCGPETMHVILWTYNIKHCVHLFPPSVWFITIQVYPLVEEFGFVYKSILKQKHAYHVCIWSSEIVCDLQDNEDSVIVFVCWSCICRCLYAPSTMHHSAMGLPFDH